MKRLRLRLLLALSCSLAWNCIIPGVFAAPVSVGPGSTAAAGPKSPALQTLYRKAMEAYDAKRYDEASDLFKQVLAKQPDHNSSKIFLARSFYQQKSLAEAFKAFQQIDIKLLEPDAAYDYGQVAFRSNDYPTAIKAFAIVPNGHPLYDLAAYYGGISAYKLGEFQQSIDLFDQAVVLPSKLVKIQKLYRKEAEKKLLSKERHELKSNNAPTKTSERPTPPAAVVPAAFVLTPWRGAFLSHRYLNQTSETKKALSTGLDLSRTELTAAWSSDKPSASAKSQLVYFASVKGMTTHDGEQEIPIMPTTDETLQFLALARSKPQTMTRTEIAGGYEMVIGDKATVGVIAGAYAYAPDSDFKNRILYSPYVSVFVSQKGDFLETSLKAQSLPRFDNVQLLVTQSVEEGTIQFNISRSAFLGLTGELNEYSYNSERLNGPNWNGRFRLQVGYAQEKSLSLTLGTFYEIAQGTRLYDQTPDVPSMNFNLSQSGAFAKAEMYLTAWWTVGISGKFIHNSYSNPEPVGTEEYLDKNYGSKISQFTLYSSLSKTF